MDYRCIQCNQPYPETGIFYRCPQCGSIYDAFDWRFVPSSCAAAPGLWRWQANFGLAQDAPQISLGEGDTPCVWSKVDGQEVAFKCEYQNPSGSYKDRGMAVLMSFIVSRGAQAAMEDSSGNAGAAFAAYAARAGLHGRVFVPAYASGPKRRQIETYGAEVISVPGTRQDVALAARQAAEKGQIYASHAHMPHVLVGYATLAYELVEQMGRAPGALITPVGQGGLLLGIGRGFKSLHAAGRIDRMPLLVGVQAAACAPFLTPAGKIENPGETLAEGVRIAEPVRLAAVKDIVAKSNGFFLDVKEDEIKEGRSQLARHGFFVEPTSALVWDALRQVISQLPKPVAVVLTGSGLKWDG
jgi:threonine synthase